MIARRFCVDTYVVPVNFIFRIKLQGGQGVLYVLMENKC